MHHVLIELNVHCHIQTQFFFIFKLFLSFTLFAFCVFEQVNKNQKKKKNGGCITIPHFKTG